MTMLSFRVDEGVARDAQAWAERLGVDRSELLRDAVRSHLRTLAGERDAESWQEQPLTEQEQVLAAVGDWGPAEDWAHWGDVDGGDVDGARADGADAAR